MINPLDYEDRYGSLWRKVPLDGGLVAKQQRRQDWKRKARGQGVQARVARFSLSQTTTGPVRPL